MFRFIIYVCILNLNSYGNIIKKENYWISNIDIMQAYVLKYILNFLEQF